MPAINGNHEVKLSEAIERTFPNHLRLTDNCYLVEATLGDLPQGVLEFLQHLSNEIFADHRLIALRLDDPMPLHTTRAFTNAYVSTAEDKKFHSSKEKPLIVIKRHH